MPVMIAEYRLDGLPEVFFIRHQTPGVWISIEAREIAAGNLEPDPMACTEDVTGNAGIDREPVHLTRFDQLRRFKRIAVADAQDTVRQVASLAVREDVNQFRREIRVGRSGRGVQDDTHF